MSGYLRTFKPTGIKELDAIMDAISDAGDYYHHTEMWNDGEGEVDGKSCVDRIQDAFDKASESLKKPIVTEREAVERERRAAREAFVAGWLERATSDTNACFIGEEAARRYPAPKEGDR